ncbi:hypothetical protein CesoFtcFv8_006915 [Champsocephalus esox]|uniref:EF-hand domain-containing protein n=1 Tax=Champsocephalus esox TaxID=159716 RepID=A0AAN8CFM9_9TELE|nr:hypothetical protein CesoFtcFv8_006915 [Champsocephalus esox]
MAKFLTQEQIDEYKECFSLYDRQRRGRIEGGDLITVMRCIGSSPTPAEVRRHLLNHSDAAGDLDFSSLLSVMHRQQQQEAPQREILEALRRSEGGEEGLHGGLPAEGETHRAGGETHTQRGGRAAAGGGT